MNNIGIELDIMYYPITLEIIDTSDVDSVNDYISIEDNGHTPLHVNENVTICPIILGAFIRLWR